MGRPSANGYLITYTNAFGTWEYHATWASPYFVFVDGMVCSEDEEPLGPIHCETLADAQRKAALGGTILDAGFEVVA